MLRWCSRNSAVTTAQIGVAAEVLRTRVAAAVAVEARDRVGPAGLQLLAQHVSLRHSHRHSIAHPQRLAGSTSSLT